MDNKIVIRGHEISDDFIKGYETYMAVIKDFEYGSLYKVNVKLNDEGVNAGIMEKIKSTKGGDRKAGFYEHNEREVMFIMEISHDDEGVHQIEIAMDYTLQGDKYGTFTWECVRT